jgi:hypothetical protein
MLFRLACLSYVLIFIAILIVIVKTQADIRLELAFVEQQHLLEGTTQSIHEMSPSGFISTGLELEEQQ